jgi:putative phage-type endonuclease
MSGLVNPVRQRVGKGIGGSQAAAACGVSPYTSRLKLWLLMTGRAEDSPMGEQARWGQILEPVVRGYFAHRNGYTGEHSRILVPEDSIYHPELPWLRATPDGLIQEDIPASLGGGSFLKSVVEVKCPSWRTAWHWGHPLQRSVPPHYRMQAVVEMAVTGLDRAEFPVLIGGSDYFELTVERDADLEAQVLEQLADFWRLVETDTPPEVDDADEWRSYFADRLPRERVEMTASPDMEGAMDDWFRAHIDLRNATKANEAARNRVLAGAVAQNANRIKTDHGWVSVRRSKSDNLFVVAPETWGQE